MHRRWVLRPLLTGLLSACVYLVLTCAITVPKQRLPSKSSPQAKQSVKSRGNSSPADTPNVAANSPAVALSSSSSSRSKFDHDDANTGLADLVNSSPEPTPQPAPPVGFNSTFWAELTSKPPPVAIPPNKIKLAYLHSLLSPTECRGLIALAEGNGFSRFESLVGGVAASRTSTTCDLERCLPLAREIRRRVARLCGKAESCIENLVVVKYKAGQQFKPHYDSSSSLRPIARRQFTVFVYLNNLTGEGGETEFPELGVKFKPRMGDALFWENHASIYSSSHPQSLHAGRPPLSGVKYGLSHCSAT